jgi:ATP/maltotriose-dependent transcriptional regulator MalT
VIVGRTAELSLVARFLDDVRAGPATLAVEGEPGAGKSELWNAAVASALGRGYRVLRARPVESEQSLPFAALGDLLDGVLDDPHLRIPQPQRRALRVALLMDDPEGDAPDQRSVSVAVLTAARAIAERGPVLIAIDDARWMDPPTARVLAFAVRRLSGEPIGVMTADRPNGGTSVAGAILEGFEGPQHRLEVQPLSLDEIDAMIRRRLGHGLTRHDMGQVATASAGNPLFALELARAILRGEIQPRPGEPLHVPDTLQQFLGTRLANLPGPVRRVLLVAAAASEPTIQLLEQTERRSSDARSAIEQAVEAGVVEVSGDQVVFTHPLFASTLYHAADLERQRELHRKLAPLVGALDEQARHLALAAGGPDPRVAAVLDDAAHRAAARGAPDAAAGFSERASELTDPADAEARRGRLIEAAEYHFTAGNLEPARRILERIASSQPPGPARASVLRRLAKVRYRGDSCSVAAQLLTRALAEAGDDRDLQAGVHRDLAWAVMLCGDMTEAAHHAESAMRIVGEEANRGTLAELLAAGAMADFLQGRGASPETMHRAVDMEDSSPEVPIEWRPSMMLAMMLKWSGDLDEAQERFGQLHRQALESGEDTSLPFLLVQMSESSAWQGDWTRARDRAEEALKIAVQTGQEPMRAAALYARALAEAHLGDVDAARASARKGLECSDRVGSVVMMMWNQGVLGSVELSMDDPGAADRQLAPLVAWRDVVGIREPGVLRFVPDEVEALIALGQLDKAESLLSEYEADAARLQRTWSMLAAARGRAALQAASGDAVGATSALEAAINRDGDRVQPFELARARLMLGSILRRTRRRKAARTSVQAALDTFTRLGARAWAQKAQGMLDSGVRASGPALAGQLTPAEQHVAEIVAAGSTNREAADRLFVSVRTVELHLTSVYRKLGIRSRTELAVSMVTGGVGAGSHGDPQRTSQTEH